MARHEFRLDLLHAEQAAGPLFLFAVRLTEVSITKSIMRSDVVREGDGYHFPTSGIHRTPGTEPRGQALLGDEPAASSHSEHSLVARSTALRSV
jgi:hypothetical protein